VSWERYLVVSHAGHVSAGLRLSFVRFYTPRSAGGKALWVARRPPNDIDESELDCGHDPAFLSHGHQLAMIFGVVAVFLRGSERVTGAEILRLKPFGKVNKTTAVKIGAVQDIH